jgi:uridine kinase
MRRRQAVTRDALVGGLAGLICTVRRPHPVRVAFDGPDTAGKTTLADEVAPAVRARGRQVVRASVDGFHRPRAQRYRLGPDSAEGYYQDSFDHETLRAALLEPLGPGGDRRYRSAAFDHRTDAPVAAPVGVAAPDAVLLFDGVFLLRPELRDAWDLRVFVTVPEEEMLRRAVVRDAELFGSPSEVEHRYRTRYIPGQRLYFASACPLETADVVVHNTDPERPVLEADPELAGAFGTRGALLPRPGEPSVTASGSHERGDRAGAGARAGRRTGTRANG